MTERYQKPSAMVSDSIVVHFSFSYQHPDKATEKERGGGALAFVPGRPGGSEAPRLHSCAAPRLHLPVVLNLCVVSLL